MLSDATARAQAPAGRPLLSQDSVLVALAFAIIALSLLRLTMLSHGLRVVCFDDAIIRDGWHDPVVASANLDLDYSIGRFYAPAKFAFLGWLQGASALVHSCIRTGALLCGAAGASWFCARWLRDPLVALIGCALFLAAFPFYEGYQAFFSNPLLFIGLGAVCASAALLDHATPLARALSLGLFALALLCHELFVLFFVLHLAQVLRTEDGFHLSGLRKLLPEIVLLVVYVSLNFSLKCEAGGAYEGTRLSFAPAAGARAFLRYSVASLPGAEIWIDRSAPGGLPLRPPLAAASLLLRRLDLFSLLLTATVGTLAYRHLAAGKEKTAVPLASTLALLGLLLVLPNVLPSLTAKYQDWAMQRHLPYYYGALGLVFGACGLVFGARLFGGAPRPVLLAIAAAPALVTLATQTMNQEVIFHLAQMSVVRSPLSP